MGEGGGRKEHRSIAPHDVVGQSIQHGLAENCLEKIADKLRPKVNSYCDISCTGVWTFLLPSVRAVLVMPRVPTGMCERMAKKCMTERHKCS